MVGRNGETQGIVDRYCHPTVNGHWNGTLLSRVQTSAAWSQGVRNGERARGLFQWAKYFKMREARCFVNYINLLVGSLIGAWSISFEKVQGILDTS